jgi:hypothetical protein
MTFSIPSLSLSTLIRAIGYTFSLMHANLLTECEITFDIFNWDLWIFVVVITMKNFEQNIYLCNDVSSIISELSLLLLSSDTSIVKSTVEDLSIYKCN